MKPELILLLAFLAVVLQLAFSYAAYERSLAPKPLKATIGILEKTK